jgi:glycosyltransferase involved in cell wall biosynthesis
LSSNWLVLKIVMITSRFPFPLEKGDKLRFFHLLKGLAERHQIILVSLHMGQLDDQHLDKVRQFCEKVWVFRLQRWQFIFNAISGLLRSLPLSIGYFYSPKVKRRIEEIVLDHQPDAVYCHLIRSAEYVKHLPFFKVIDYMDCFSVGMLRRMNNAKGIMRYLWRLEYEGLARYERQVYHKFDRHAIISVQDRNYLPVHQKSRISVIGNGVDIGRFRDFEKAEKYDILFVGNMGYYPNVSAVRFLVHEILPPLLVDYPDMRVLLAGARPRKAVRSLQSRNVEVSGWLPRIEWAYASSRIFVAPLFESTGLQNKILEAMGAGIPCITTPLVNNSIGAVDDQSILIAHNASGFVSKIRQILRDHQLKNLIVANASNFVRENFDWDISVRELEQLLKADKLVSANE